MTRRVELADVVRAHGCQVERPTPEQARVLRAIADCRTAALGGHVRECDQCGHREISYNSCRDRHCPKCQGLDETRWVEARQADLLPVPYFHLVFTVPDALHPLFRAHPRLAYHLLFQAVAETLQEVTFRRLGARIGFTALLHTWTQLLLFHPHLHCLVPGGGLDATGTRWIPSRRAFFVPVRILSEVFRGKLLSKLEELVAKGRIHCRPGENLHRLLRNAAGKKWVVYSKPPFAGPRQVLAYLGRYTHRIAISNDRLVSMKDGEVTFRWKDRANGNAPRLQTLDAPTFLRRFLLHVLPSGFVRVRHYGFLANSVRHDQLARCRELLGLPPDAAEPRPSKDKETWEEMLLRLTGTDVTRCPRCKVGRFRVVEEMPPSPVPWNSPARARSP